MISAVTSARSAQIGYMPENDAFIADMTAVTFVRMMGELSGLPAQTALERAHEVLFYVGLGEARYRKLGTYSLGMKQMAKLAQALVHGPRLLILDEPTNGLDPIARQRMVRLIRDIRDSGHMHILLCSHLLRDVEETCEEVLILKQGQIVHYSNLEKERSANRRFVELETSGDEARLADALAQLGCAYTTVGTGRFRMVLPEGFDLREVFLRGGGARPAAAAGELSSGHARRHLPESDGGLTWRSTNRPIRLMRAGGPRAGRVS